MAESKEKMVMAGGWDRTDSSKVIGEYKEYLEPMIYYILISGLLFSQFSCFLK